MSQPIQGTTRMTYLYSGKDYDHGKMHGNISETIRQQNPSLKILGHNLFEYMCLVLELGGAEKDWIRILLGLNFSSSAGGVSGHAQISDCRLLFNDTWSQQGHSALYIILYKIYTHINNYLIIIISVTIHSHFHHWFFSQLPKLPIFYSFLYRFISLRKLSAFIYKLLH